MVHGLKYLLPFFDELSVRKFPPLFLRFLFLCLSCLPSFRSTFVLWSPRAVDVTLKTSY